MCETDDIDSYGRCIRLREALSTTLSGDECAGPVPRAKITQRYYSRGSKYSTSKPLFFLKCIRQTFPNCEIEFAYVNVSGQAVGAGFSIHWKQWIRHILLLCLLQFECKKMYVICVTCFRKNCFTRLFEGSIYNILCHWMSQWSTSILDYDRWLWRPLIRKNLF